MCLPPCLWRWKARERKLQQRLGTSLLVDLRDSSPSPRLADKSVDLFLGMGKSTDRLDGMGRNSSSNRSYCEDRCGARDSQGLPLVSWQRDDFGHPATEGSGRDPFGSVKPADRSWRRTSCKALIGIGSTKGLLPARSTCLGSSGSACFHAAPPVADSPPFWNSNRPA